MPTSSSRVLLGALLSSSVFLASLTACGGDEAEVIDRETFIATYVDLRVEALMNEDREITDEERARVLTDFGVTEDQLLAFTEVMGRDVTYMRDLWDEVEERLDAMRPEIDESGRVVRPVEPRR